MSLLFALPDRNLKYICCFSIACFCPFVKLITFWSVYLMLALLQIVNCNQHVSTGKDVLGSSSFVVYMFTGILTNLCLCKILASITCSIPLPISLPSLAFLSSWSCAVWTSCAVRQRIRTLVLTRIRINTMSFAIAIVVLVVRNMIPVMNWNDLMRGDRNGVEGTLIGYPLSRHASSSSFILLILDVHTCAGAIVLLSTLHQDWLEILSLVVSGPLVGNGGPR